MFLGFEGDIATRGAGRSNHWFYESYMIDGVMTREQVVDRLSRLMSRNRRGVSRRRAEEDGIERLASVLIPGAAARVDDRVLRGKGTAPAFIDEVEPDEMTEDQAAAVARQAQADRDCRHATIAFTARHAV